MDYAEDKTGISSFMLPFMLTVAEYIGLQDPVLVTTNEDGELVSMPEQMDLLIGKLINLARLKTLPNAEKKRRIIILESSSGRT